MLKPRFRLERLGKDAALSAIGGPIQSTHRSYYENSVEELNIEIESLVDELLKIRVETPTGKHGEIVGEFVEPIQLQVVCQRWWRERYKGRHQGKTPSQVILSVQKKSKELIDVDSALKDFYVEAVREASKEAEIYEGVANYNDNTMSVIDGKTNAVISTVNVGNGPGRYC